MICHTSKFVTLSIAVEFMEFVPIYDRIGGTKRGTVMYFGLIMVEGTR